MESVHHTTLLDLVRTVSNSCHSDTEVVATVAALINSGQVRLCGTFAGARIDLTDALDIPHQQGRENCLLPHTPETFNSESDFSQSAFGLHGPTRTQAADFHSE